MSDVLTLGLPLAIRSEDGQDYIVDAWKPTIQDVYALWNRYSKYRVLFADVTAGNFDYFREMVLAKTTIVLPVSCAGEEVGILYGTRLRIPHDITAHYFFWDRKTAGRHVVLLRTMKWFMDEFHIHRVKVAIPKHAFAALHRVQRMGLRLEGVEREGMLYDGKWSDMLLFAVLESELTEQALNTGVLERTPAETNWFGLLQQDELLMRKVVERRTP